jgi:hypothetical protein
LVATDRFGEVTGGEALVTHLDASLTQDLEDAALPEVVDLGEFSCWSTGLVGRYELGQSGRIESPI